MRRDSGTEPLLRFEKVNKFFGGLHVLKDIDLAVSPGSVYVLIGPSGSGKSTLLRCVNGLERVQSGHILFMGAPLPTTDGGLRKVREQIGFVFQSFNLFPHLTAMGNVSLALRIVKRTPRNDAREKARQFLERVGLADKMHAFPDQLSGGQQQRVSIARALAMEPRLMLFDEPTSALDPELTSEVLNVMLELARSGMTMLVVSHELSFVRKAATRVALIHDGRILEEGPPERMFKSPTTETLRNFLKALE